MLKDVREEVGYRDALASKNLNYRSGRSEGNEPGSFYILVEKGAWKCNFILPYYMTERHTDQPTNGRTDGHEGS